MHCGIVARPGVFLLALSGSLLVCAWAGQTSQGSSTAPAAISAIERDFEANRFREARVKARELVRSQPGNALAWTYLGMASVRLGEADAAIAAFERAIAINPKDARPFYDLALLYANRNDLDKAIDRYQKGLAIEGRNQTAQFNYGRLLMLKGRLPEAQNAFRRALEINPNDFAAHLQLSRLALARHDLESAVRFARRAVELAPPSLEANLALAEAYISARQDLAALEHLQKVEPLFQNAAAFHYTLGIAQYRAQRFHPAVASFRKAVELDPGLDLAQFLLASALLGTGDLDHAESGFQAAIAIQPNQVLYYNYLARVYEQKGPAFRAAALDATKHALRLDPKDIESRKRLAQWAKQDGDLPRARQLLEDVVREDGTYVPARVLLAIVYHRLNLREKAEEQQQAVRLLEAQAQKRQRAPYTLE